MAEPSATADGKVWRELAERAIGASLDTLQSRTFEGLRIAPLYGRAATPDPQPWRSQRAWAIGQRVDHPDADDANGLALQDLQGGADALILVDRASPYARGFGADLSTPSLDRVLDDVDLDFIKVRLDAGPSTPQALGALAELVVARRLTSAALDVDVGFDPIGWRARLGTTVPTDASSLSDLRARAGLGGTLFLADGRPWREAGAGEAEELAIVLATGLSYLRMQEAAGIKLADARDAVAILIAADADMFLGIAKVRATRRLWSRVVTACGLPDGALRLHVETSWRMMSRCDPWINVMRATAAAFAAALGGADVIGVLPFTLPLGLPDEPARRLGRNVQRILIDEAHLARVQDTAAGSGAFEGLTHDLCTTAWALFQDIERAGGMERAASSGFLRDRIAATAAKRGAAIATLRAPLIGTSRYAVPDAPAAIVLDVAPRPQAAPGKDALPVLRDSEPFENLRERAARLAKPPLVFLATDETPESNANAAFAATFFAAAGIAACDPQRFSPEAFAASGAPLACLCTRSAAATDIEALESAGALAVFVMGPLDAAPNRNRIFDGCDAPAILAVALSAIEGTHLT